MSHNKRKQPPGGGGGGGHRYNRRGGGNGFKRIRMGQSSADLASGIAGVLVTHAPGKAGPCVTEFRDWFMRWVDELYPEVEATGEQLQRGSGGDGEEGKDQIPLAEAKAPNVSVDSALEAELRELRGEAEEERRRQRRENPQAAGAGGEPLRRQLREVAQVGRGNQAVCLHLSHPGRVDVSEVVRRMLIAVREGEEPARARHAIKVIPFQGTCFSDPETLQKVARPLVQGALAEEPPGTTWGIVFEKTQDNERMDRAECIRLLTSLVPRHCAVDLRNPRWTILVRVLGRVTGVSVVRDYRELARYNLRELRAKSLDKLEERIDRGRVLRAVAADEQEQQAQRRAEAEDESEDAEDGDDSSADDQQGSGAVRGEEAVSAEGETNSEPEPDQEEDQECMWNLK